MAAKKKGDSLTKEDKLKVALVPEEEQPYQIPENWVWTQLHSVVSINPPKKQAADLVPETMVTFVPMAAVDDVAGEITAPLQRPLSEVKTGYTQFTDGDVIFAKITPCMENGKTALVRETINGIAYGSTEFFVLRPLGVDASLIYFFVRSRSFRNQAKQVMNGAVGQQRVPKSWMEHYPFPLPPLPEQQRIAEKLELLLGKIKEAKALLDEIPEFLQSFRQTVLAAACSGRLTEDWRKVNQNIKGTEKLLKRKKNLIYKAHQKGLPSVSELIDDDLPPKWVFATLPYLVSNKKYSIKRGPFGSSLRKEYFVESGYKVYEQQHAIRNDFTLGSYYISKDKFNELKAFEVNEGDLIMSCSGTIGRIAVVPHTFEKGIVNQALLKLTLDNEIILTEFFLFMFSDYLTKQEFVSMTKGNAITNIASVTELKKIYFPVPPLPEQAEIVRRVESLFVKIDDLEAQYKESMELIETLPEIILSKAFRGKLVPQNPNDEPALVLLENIVAMKESLLKTGGC